MLFLQNNRLAQDYILDAEYAFRQYSDMVFALAYQRCNGSYSDAQDVVGEVFYRLCKRKPTIESEEHLKAWLLRVTINCSKSMLTSAWNKHTCAMPEDIAANALDVEESQVYNAVMRLPINQRTCIHLFYYREMSIEEIAAAMSANPNTVKSWLRRGREKLKTELKENID